MSNSSSPLKRALAAYHKLDLSEPGHPRPSRVLPQRAKSLNATELARLTQRYESGVTVYKLADELRVDRRTVALRLKQLGTIMRNQPPSDAVVEQMITLYESGLSLAAVGQQIDLNATTVLRHLRARDVQIRPGRGGRRKRAVDSLGI